MIGKKLYKGQYTNKEYADTAVWCNSNNAHLEDKGAYFEVVKNTDHTPSLEEQVIQLEQQYQMNRWQREIILSKDSGASDYTKAKAQMIEDLAEELRKLEAGK